MLIWPVLALLVVLLFYKRDITPPWNPPLPPHSPQAWPPLPPPAHQQAQKPSQPVAPDMPPPMDLDDVFRRPRR